MMQRMMGAITGDGQVVVQTGMPLPEAGPSDVTIKVEVSLISPGTELAMIQGRRSKPEPGAEPSPFGYACAGTVLNAPEGARHLPPGCRVFAMGAGKALHADVVQVPLNLVAPIPEAVPFDEAVYACLGATALQSVRRARPELGEYGLILGLGIVGNLAAQLSRLSGARVCAWESFPGRRALAERCGIDCSFDPNAAETLCQTEAFAAPYGIDFSIFSFGGMATETYETVKHVMKESADGHRMGRIVLVGGCRMMVEGGAAGGNLDILVSSRTGPGYHDPAWEAGAHYPAVFVPFTTQRNIAEILNLMAEKRLVVSPLTTHTFSLREIARATDLLSGQPDRALGIVLTRDH
jgi:polar amino acid transport system substrate-binding protein